MRADGAGKFRRDFGKIPRRINTPDKAHRQPRRFHQQVFVPVLRVIKGNILGETHGGRALDRFFGDMRVLVTRRIGDTTGVIGRVK